MCIGDSVAEPSALSEPDRSESISGINPEVTNQCGKGHTTTLGINVVCDRPFFAVSVRPGCRHTDHRARALTDLDRHLQERHRLDGPESRRYRPEGHLAGGEQTGTRRSPATSDSSYAIRKTRRVKFFHKTHPTRSCWFTGWPPPRRRSPWSRRVPGRSRSCRAPSIRAPFP